MKKNFGLFVFALLLLVAIIALIPGIMRQVGQEPDAEGEGKNWLLPERKDESVHPVSSSPINSHTPLHLLAELEEREKREKPAGLTGYVVQRFMGADVRVEGATVWISDQVVAEGGVLRLSPAGTQTVSTDDSGVFHFDNLPIETDLFLVVKKDEFQAPVSEPLIARLSANREGEPVEIRLPEASEVVGRVVDPEGRSVPGAQVLLQHFNHKHQYPVYPPNKEFVRDFPAKNTICDLEGRFVLSPLPEGAQLTLAARAEGYGEGRMERVRPSTPFEDIEIVLTRGCSVSGWVLDALTSAPVVGADLMARSWNPHIGKMVERTRTDNAGAFRFEGLSPGNVEVKGEMREDGVLTKVIGPKVPFEMFDLSEGESLEGLELVSRNAPETMSVRGRVFDRQTSQTIEGARITFTLGAFDGFQRFRNYTERFYMNNSPDAARNKKYATSDERGEFEIQDLLALRYGVSVVHEDYRLFHPKGGNLFKRPGNMNQFGNGGYGNQFGNGGFGNQIGNVGFSVQRGGLTVDLHDPRNAENLVLLMDGSTAIEGVVLDPSGSPVVGVGVFLERKLARQGFGNQGFGQQGFGQQGFGNQGFNQDDYYDDEEYYDELDGYDKDKANYQFPGSYNLPGGPGYANNWQTVAGKTLTNEEGYFRFPHIDFGKNYRVLTETFDSWESATSEMVELTREKPAVFVTIRVKEGGAISGIVTDEEGNPVPLANLHAMKVDPETQRATMRFGNQFYAQRLPSGRSDSSGRYRLGGFSAGRYRLMASRAGFEYAQSEEIDMRLGVEITGVDIVLKKMKTFSLRGILVDLNAQPVANWKVTLRDNEGDRYEHTAHDGTFEFEFPMREASNSALRLSRLEFSLEKSLSFSTGVFGRSEDEEMVFILPAGGSLRGRLLYGDGSGPVASEYSYRLILQNRLRIQNTASSVSRLGKDLGTNCVLTQCGIRMSSQAEDGRFEIPFAPMGSLDFSFQGEEVLMQPSRIVEVGVNGMDLGDILVERPAKMTLQPVDPQTGEPLFEAFKKRHPKGELSPLYGEGWTGAKEPIPLIAVMEGNVLNVKNVPFGIRRMVLKFIRVDGTLYRTQSIEISPVQMNTSGLVDLGVVPIDLEIEDSPARTGSSE